MEMNETTKNLQQSLFSLISSLKLCYFDEQNQHAGIFSLISRMYYPIQELYGEYFRLENEPIDKTMLIKRMEGILPHFIQIEKVFYTASLPEVSNNFSNGQRQLIKRWKQIAERAKHDFLQEVSESRIWEEMNNLNLDEGAVKETPDISDQENKMEEDLDKLKDDNDPLSFQMEATESKIMALQI